MQMTKKCKQAKDQQSVILYTIIPAKVTLLVSAEIVVYKGIHIMT